MSTKKTREALKRLHSMLPTTETHVMAEALAEVEAIEAMALNVVEKGGKEALYRANYGPSVELLERIAKDAP